MINSEAIDQAIDYTLEGLFDVAETIKALEARKIRGAFDIRNGKAVSYCGYDYASQRWISRGPAHD